MVHFNNSASSTVCSFYSPNVLNYALFSERNAAFNQSCARTRHNTHSRAAHSVISNAESSITAGDCLQKKWRENFKLHFRTRTRHLNLISSEREEICECLTRPNLHTFTCIWISLKYGFFLAFLLYIQWHPESGVACQPEHRIPPAAVIRKFPASEMNIHSISPAGKYI